MQLWSANKGQGQRAKGNAAAAAASTGRVRTEDEGGLVTGVQWQGSFHSFMKSAALLLTYCIQYQQDRGERDSNVALLKTDNC
jgi:hypothetical protein